MRTPQLAARTVRILAVPLLAAGVSPAAAAAAQTGPPGPAGSLTITGQLFGVAATSASNAWAVGTSSGKTLIVHWNGASWTQVASPSPGPVAPSPAWPRLPPATPGRSATPRRRQDPDRALERHGVEAGAQPEPRGRRGALRRGRDVRQQRLGGRLHRSGGQDPDRAVERQDLDAGAQPEPRARPASPAWPRPPPAAPGRSAARPSSGPKTLILRWNGTAWKQVPSPSPGAGSRLPQRRGRDFGQQRLGGRCQPAGLGSSRP